MKRLLSIVLVFATLQLFSQTKTTIYGNLGIENANISIANTQYGTSTDDRHLSSRQGKTIFPTSFSPTKPLERLTAFSPKTASTI